MGEGASYLSLPIVRCFPQPPDIAVAGHVPGGVLLPCAPENGTATTTGKKQYLVDFAFKQGVRLTIKRIHVDLPLLMAENELEEHTEEEINFTEYETEPEVAEAVHGKGGRLKNFQTIKPISYAAPYEFTSGEITLEFGFSKEVKETRKTRLKRSVLPITVTIQVQLNGPGGELWAQSFDAELHYVYGNPGLAIGTAHIAMYADLVNPLVIDPDKVYGLQLYMLVPSSVKTNMQIGTIAENETIKFGNGGEVRFFYDIETGSPGK